MNDKWYQVFKAAEDLHDGAETAETTTAAVRQDLRCTIWKFVKCFQLNYCIVPIWFTEKVFEISYRIK